ncbi:hypothetical protein NVP2275O_344 [Vibrio phage 2.275.O._10N.286.54.E11]|nr:hypothetical protein NVP2275O_344 [Vibrio phage 2.275.O._10N.286.54.E11]
MSNKEKIAMRIHATVWQDEELNVTEIVELIADDTGVNAIIEDTNLQLNLAEKSQYVFHDHMADFERLRPSPFMKDPIGYMMKKLRGEV